MPDYPPEALEAAALAIHRAACPLRDDPDHDCARDAAAEEMLVPRARAALDAAAPVLAEAWGVAEDMTPATEHGIRTNGGHVMRPHPSVPGTPVRRTVARGPWQEVPR